MITTPEKKTYNSIREFLLDPELSGIGKVAHCYHLIKEAKVPLKKQDLIDIATFACEQTLALHKETMEAVKEIQKAREVLNSKLKSESCRKCSKMVCDKCTSNTSKIRMDTDVRFP